MTIAGESYFFEHLLTREAAYSALLEHNRRALHGIAADVLAARIVPGSQSEWELLPQLAAHLEAAGRGEEARRAACAQLVLMAETGRYDRWDPVLEQVQRQRAPESAGGEGSTEEYYPLLQARGLRDYAEGRFALGAAQLERALTGARLAQDAGSEGSLLLALGAALQRLGQIEAAQRHFELALEQGQAYSLPEQQCQALRRLAILHRDASRREDAERCSREALRLARECGSLRLECQTRIALGNEAKMYRGWAEAGEHFALGLELALACGDLESQSACLAGHAEVLAVRGESSAALEEAQRALATAQATGNARSQSFALNIIGCAQTVAGSYDAARAALEASLALSAQAQHPWGRMLTLHYLARLERAQGDVAAAGRAFAEAADIAAQLGHHAVAAEMRAASLEAELVVATSLDAVALQSLEQQLPPLAETSAQLGVLWSHLPACLCARLYHALGREAECQAWLSRAATAAAEFEAFPQAIPWREVQRTREMLVL